MSKLHVLFIDDERLILNSLKRVLRGSDRVEGTFVESFAEAEELLDQSFFDGVVVDWQMPEVNGVAVLKYLKDRFPRVGRLLMSGDTKAFQMDPLWEPDLAGMVVNKPWAAEDLQVMLDWIENFRKGLTSGLG